MVRAARRAVPLAWLWFAALPLLAPAAARPAPDDVPSDAGAAASEIQVALVEPPLVASVPLFVIPGVRDSTTAATVFHCSNPTASNQDFLLEYFGPTGTFVCGFSGIIAAGSTVTVATRNTALFVETGTCDIEGYLPVDRGLAKVYIGTQANVICTAQVVDPANATPTYLGSLDVFRP